MDIGVKELLVRDTHDSCVVESVLWLPPWNSSIDTAMSVSAAGAARGSVRIYSAGVTSAVSSIDLEALNRVLGTGQRMRRRSVCWLPLFNHRTEIIAILRVERKFSDVSDATLQLEASSESTFDVDSATLRHHQQQQLPTIAHLTITELEEEMLSQFASFAVPLLERMDFIAEAYSGVHQAGQAILALQNVKVSIEDKYTLEVSRRLELEESLRAGAEMLGMTSSAR